MHENSMATEDKEIDPKTAEQILAENPEFTEDSSGQIELSGIDTPLGEKCESFIMADAQFKAATEARNMAMLDLVEEMKQSGKRTVKYKGDTLQFQPGHMTPEKIKFVPNQ